MSIQMTLVFTTLVVQMIVLLILLLPLPFVVRTKIIQVSYGLQNSQNFKVGIIFSTFLLVLQFLDCWNRLKKFGFTRSPYFTQTNQAPPSLNYDQLASKFYSQRNLYLSGAVLYLGLAIATVVTIVRKLVKKEAELRNLLHEKSDDEGEIEKYKLLIKKRKIDIETFKKQLNNLQKSYNELNRDNKNENKKND